jgi:hypothetical protein
MNIELIQEIDLGISSILEEYKLGSISEFIDEI